MQSPLRCSCQSLWKSYGHKEVLKSCTLNVFAGEMVGLVGENGSGKSTLVRCLLGFTPSTQGKIWVDPFVGYCPQENYLNNRLTLSEHLALVGDIYRLDHEVDVQFVRSTISTLHLEAFLHTRIGYLSSGTYQKVKFITSIAHRPALIILDEPCDGFDWAMYQAFWGIMEDIVAAGSAVLMISHLVYDRERFHRIYELREGTCEQTR